MPEVIQKESIHTVLETMKKVISEPTATGYGLHREEYTLAGKTGTAEIKLSKEEQQEQNWGGWQFLQLILILRIQYC